MYLHNSIRPTLMEKNIHLPNIIIIIIMKKKNLFSFDPQVLYFIFNMSTLFSSYDNFSMEILRQCSENSDFFAPHNIFDKYSNSVCIALFISSNFLYFYSKYCAFILFMYIPEILRYFFITVLIFDHICCC